jgi:nucleoside-diphosphate-sugar epimerase
VKVLITGADGFIGRALVDRLLSTGIPGEATRPDLVLVDRFFIRQQDEPGIRRISGDLGDEDLMRGAVGDGVDYVFHLASVPGGAAEGDFELGHRSNLLATMQLLDLLRRQQRRARFVFASTIGVYGVPMPPQIDEELMPVPSLSYGAQKLMAEIMIHDQSRRGFIDGRSLRLPGIVARPQASGMLSAFLSELIRTLAAGIPFTCPVSAQGMSWWMSRTCVVDNLLHAARLSPAVARQRSAWLLPVIHASIGDMVDALATVYGPDRRSLVKYEPSAGLEAQFASYPPLKCPASVAAGFCNDGTLENLVRRAIEGP